MRIAVQGAGALGRLIAARLALAGIDVALLDRRPERAARFAREGVTLTERDGTTRNARVEAFAVSARPVRRCDWLIVCVKAFDVAQALAEGRAWLGEGEQSGALVLSNGLGHSERLLGYETRVGVALGVTYTGALAAEATGVRAMGGDRIEIGHPSRRSASRHGREVAEIVELLDAAGFQAEEIDPIEPAVWKKVAVNCGINPLAALVGVSNGVLPRTPAFPMAVAASVETARVANAVGVALDAGEERWADLVRSVCEESGENRCSMLEDLRAGRRTEIDSLCLAVSRLGAEYGIETPCNRLLGSIVQAVSTH